MLSSLDLKNKIYGYVYMLYIKYIMAKIKMVLFYIKPLFCLLTTNTL